MVCLRDSFSHRFCDDLTEVVLNFLPIDHKIKLTEVSKQFRRCLQNIHRKQRILVSHQKIMNSIYDRNNYWQLLTHPLNGHKMDIKKFVKVLQIFPKITEIYVEDNDITNMNEVFDAIIDNSSHLMSLYLDFKDTTVQQFNRFCQKFGQQITSFGFFDLNVEEYVSQLSKFPNLVSITDFKMSGLFRNNELLVKNLRKAIINAYLIDYSLFDVFFENNSDLVYLGLELEGIESYINYILEKAVTLKKLRKLYLSLDSKYGRNYTEIDLNIIKKCGQLTHLTLECNLIAEHFFIGFDIVFPHLKYLNIEIRYDISDKGLESISKLKLLESLSLNCLNINSFPRITDSGVVALINGCKRLSNDRNNVFISPFSTSTAFGMLYSGAKGQTAQEIREVVGYNFGHLSDQLIEEQILNVLKDIESVDSNKYELSVANKVVVQKNFNILQTFKEIVENYYKSSVETLDFVNQPQEAVESINKWVGHQTHHKIEKLLEKPLSRLTHLVLLNAVYFKGLLQIKFFKNETQRQTFFCNHQMMSSVPVISTDTAIKTLVMARDLDDSNLKRNCLEFIRHHMKEVIETEDWLNIQKTNPRLLDEIVLFLSNNHSIEAKIRWERTEINQFIGNPCTLSLMDCTTYIHGIPWKISVSKESQYLVVGLYCAKSEMPRDFSCHVSGELAIISFQKAVPDITDKFDWTFKCGRAKVWEFKEFAPLDTFFDRNNAYIINDRMVLEATLVVDPPKGVVFV